MSIYYPENLFDELLTGVGRHDLLSLENVLAEGVTAIVVVLESAGALTELGAFANHPQLRSKLVVVQDKAHQRDRSFIQMGPVRLLRKLDNASVVDADFDNLDRAAIATLRAITSRRKTTSSFNISNLFHTREFILPIIYALQVLSRYDLVEMLNLVAPVGSDRAEATIAGSLSMLLAEGLVAMTPAGYALTAQGVKTVRRVRNGPLGGRTKTNLARRNRVLDDIRIDVLNDAYRRQGRVFSA